MTYRDLWRSLCTLYDENEAHAIVDLVLQEAFNMSKADVLCGGVETLGAENGNELQAVMRRLRNAEPVQYVLGHAGFCGKDFRVRHGVLIPRPETEELCRWIAEENENSEAVKVLDIGSGSGCIAVTLALNLPQADVCAWDVSPEAILLTQENATLLNVHVTVERHDILSAEPNTAAWNMIVSNPPYICEKEKTMMHANVLMHEPPLALFVPDNDPLLFYRAIVRYAAASLRPHGSLYFELNPLHAAETAWMLRKEGFENIIIKRDEQGKERMVKAEKEVQT